jgi:hypothetical protein
MILRGRIWLLAPFVQYRRWTPVQNGPVLVSRTCSPLSPDAWIEGDTEAMRENIRAAEQRVIVGSMSISIYLRIIP